MWQAVLSGKVDLYVTTDILLEYSEIFTEYMNKEISEMTLDLLTDLPNIYPITKYFFWQLIEVDPDDNKFFDCAVAGNVRYLVSEGHHFKIIKKYPYFNIELVSLEEFKSRLMRPNIIS